MIVALTAWGNRISPVFDAATTLLVVDISNAEVVSRSFEPFNPEMRQLLTELLKALKIDILICGGISEISSNIIESSGIKLIPFIGGRIEEVLDVFIKGEQIRPNFLMPGCGRRHREKTRGYALSRDKAFSNHREEVKSMPKGNGRCPQGQRGQGQGQGAGSGKGRGQGTGGGRGQGQGAGGGRGQGQGAGGGRGQGQGAGGGRGRS
jgi:predicted Fe-Mo cluster-binding NifX family protein